MKKFFIKGTGQACLNDRLANAKIRVHTDLRSMEAKIYNIANMSMGDYFRDKSEKAVFRNLQELIDDAGFIITPETSYMEVASIIKKYTTAYPDDIFCVDLAAYFLHPVWRFAGALHNAASKQSRKNPVMRNFYVWMDEYVSVLECIFPKDAYQQYLHTEIYSKTLFREQILMLPEFVYQIINDSNELDNKWPLLLKLMIDPYAQFYREQKIESEDKWESLGDEDKWETL